MREYKLAAMGAWQPLALLAPVIAVGLVADSAPAGQRPAVAPLPQRIERIVLHTPGGPDYGRPEHRFRFVSPSETMRLWSPHFGAHWIVWTDGGLWPRHPEPRTSSSWSPDLMRPASSAERRRIAREAAPVYGHVIGHNADTVGIEVAHPGRTDAPFSEPQLRSVVWLLRTLMDMSAGRIQPADILGHKDLDSRPAYVDDACDGPRCAYYADASGEPYRRRVDPPESLFRALAAEGLAIPRPAAAEADRDLMRAEAMPAGTIPKVREPDS